MKTPDTKQEQSDRLKEIDERLERIREKRRIAQAKWRLRHPEAAKLRHVKERSSPEKLERLRELDRIRGARYRDRHRERVREFGRQNSARWWAKHPEEAAASHKRNREKNQAERAAKLWDWLVEKQDKFWSQVQRGDETSCWPWTGYRTYQNYGRFTVKSGVRRQAHRVAFELTQGGLLPDNVFCLHNCDNPPCCNPGHLRAGSQKQNIADKFTRGRHTPRSGHKITKEIAACIKSDPRTHEKIAADYGVSRSFVTMIKMGTRWSRV